MKRTAELSDGLSPERRRRLVQVLFIIVNLALVETHVPGPLWLVVGGVFWLALVGITVAGSGLVCGTMCWIGAIQLEVDARIGSARFKTFSNRSRGHGFASTHGSGAGSCSRCSSYGCH